MISWGSFCVCILHPSKLKYCGDTHFWSDNVHGRPLQKIPASVTLWHFSSHCTFSWLLNIFMSLSVILFASSISASYFVSVGSLTFVRLVWRSEFKIMFSCAKIAYFNWIRAIFSSNEWFGRCLFPECFNWQRGFVRFVFGWLRHVMQIKSLF